MAAAAAGGSGPQDKRLGSGEIQRLEEGTGQTAHQIKAEALGTNKGLSRFDLFKNQDGDIFVKPKRGNGEPQATGLNINDY